MGQADDRKSMTYTAHYDNRLGNYNMADQEMKANRHEQTVKHLDSLYICLKRQILRYQSYSLGLFPNIGDPENPSQIGNVRDSIYCATATWALSQAYRRIDDDQGRTYELSQSAVKCMRGILFCWLRQADKPEKFKRNQSAVYALQSKFHIVTGDPVSRDEECEHLQIDVVALFLLSMVQMISAGLEIIFTTDEVNFIQNLVFYVERAYRTPDYGMWERGSKYNNGSSELHASSIGLAKAALESINGLNLFGEQGASWSVIYVDIDAHNRNRTIFETVLPRESNSKNTDASLLPTICWPGFATHESHLRSRTVEKVQHKLQGKYGIKRYLRDGLHTVVEDKNRKYYKPAEIKMFDGIECEWPIFYLFLIIDGMFENDKESVKKYIKMLKPLLKETSNGITVPKYYYVPADVLMLERSRPGSQRKVASLEGSNGTIFLWGQAVYLVSQLLVEGLISLSDLDPIRRHLPASERPRFSSRYSCFQGTPPDLVIQVVLIAESVRLQQQLATYGIQTQTPHQVEPIQIWAPQELTKAYEYLGINKKLNLTGRPSRPFGGLSTSKVYRVCGKTVLCYPLLFEDSDFYLSQDLSLVIDNCKNDLAFLSKCWKLDGRPTFCMILRESNMRGSHFGEYLELLSQLKRGEVDGVRVRTARLQSLISSACVEHLDFLHSVEDPSIFISFQEKSTPSAFRSLSEVANYGEVEEEQSIVYQDMQHRSVVELVHALRMTDSYKMKAQILHILLNREGAHYRIEDSTITQRLEALSHKAGLHRHWWVVRFCSALLGKLVDSLAPSITSILVRGKQVTLGVFGHEEEVVDKPVSPNEIKNILYGKCLPYDICQAVLQQELIIYIGKLIGTAPELFDGILKIRIGWFVHAMQIELAEIGRHVDISNLSPHHVKRHLIAILTRTARESDTRTPLRKRQLDGALNRVPKDFYDNVWETLERTPGGIKVAGYLLPQQPTLSDMTMYELNFSLLVEQMLSKIVDPSYRQIVVETFMVVSTILRRNPELEFQKAVEMDKIIGEAFEEFQRDRSRLQGEEKQDDMNRFYNTPPNIKHGTTAYISKAVVRNLLDGEMHLMTEDMCVLS
ncbi:phosphorylase b kinase regulatory subunit beta-like [Liolophura sinensis]|uniref:phosphorylase b kinase regulatory subunit beta-like n=1 Tax=Liolophura sinensis TaxID=3198878 RepID=UPI0031597668